MEVCSEEDLKNVVKILLPSLIEISKNVHGTRSIQKLIQVLSNNLEEFEQQVFKMIEVLAPKIRELSLVLSS